MTAPMPLFGQIHQFALHGIASYPPLRQAQGRLLLKTQGRDAHSFGSGRKSRSGRKLGDRRDVPQLKLSDPILPISRLPVTVGDSQDSNHRFPLVVNHSIWKTTENKLPGVEVTSWPTSGCRPYEVNRAIYLSDKLIGGDFILFQIPTDGRLEFRKCGWVNVQRLSGH